MGQTYVYNLGSFNNANSKDIPIEVGLFFDGTGNNHRNVEIRKKIQKIDEYADQSKPENRATFREKRIYYTKPFLDDSYMNDFSNIARLWRGVDQENYGIYIEGIGTNDERMDNIYGMAYGEGNTGIRAKVIKGCEKLAEKIKKEIGDRELKKIQNIYVTIDVFGFSRGAAAARNFLYEIGNNKKDKKDLEIRTKTGFTDRNRKEIYYDKNDFQVKPAYLDNGKMPKMGYLGYYLLKNKLSKEDLEKIKIKIRFVGLYDTVASYGKEHKDDIKQLQLNNFGNITKVSKVVHFTAMDEHRKNFALSRIPKGANFIEKEFPGVHSDIGGGYSTDTEEETIIEIDYATYKKCKKERDILISEYWYNDEQLTIHNEFWAQVSLDYPEERYEKNLYKLRGKRKVKKEYSYIPLHFMEELFRSSLKETKGKLILKSSAKEYSIKRYTTLIRSKNHLRKYVIEGTEGKWKFIPDEKLQLLREKDSLKERQQLKEMQKPQEKLKKRSLPPTVKVDNLYVSPKYPEQHRLISKEHQKEVVKEKIIREVIIHNDMQQVLRILRKRYLHRSAKLNFKDSIAHSPAPKRRRPIVHPNKK